MSDRSARAQRRATQLRTRRIMLAIIFLLLIAAGIFLGYTYFT